MAGDAVQSDQFWLHWFRDAARVLASFTKPTGCGFVFCDYRTVHLVERAFAGCAGWYVGQCLVWDREATGMGSPFRASHEMIAFVRGPNFQWAGPRNVRNVLRCRWPYNETPHHPAEKPVALISRLIELTLPLGGRVFDPFAGGGSTLVAARNIGRKAIGIEIDEHYCDVVRRRCSQEVLPLEAS
jgi:site-specific DNA-methyltransferase (adenine-specific)